MYISFAQNKYGPSSCSHQIPHHPTLLFQWKISQNLWAKSHTHVYGTFPLLLQCGADLAQSVIAGEKPGRMFAPQQVGGDMWGQSPACPWAGELGPPSPAAGRAWLCPAAPLRSSPIVRRRSGLRIIEWFGLEGTFKDHLSPTPLPWAGTPSTRSGGSKPHPTWP